MTTLHVSGASDVIVRCITQCCGLDHRQDVDQLAAWCERYSPDNLLALLAGTGNYAIVAATTRAPVGSAALTRSGQINHVFVDPQAQQQGNGRRLLAALEAEAQRRWFSSIYVDSTATALPFFLHLGFRVPDGQSSGLAGQAPVRLIKFLR